jgi:hypothetical protein
MRYSWQQDKDGYIRRWAAELDGGRECRLARWIMEFPEGVVDHINGNILDNRIDNLRVVSIKENRWNSKEKGVTQLRNGKYMARIMINGKRKTIGCSFYTRAAAEAAYRVEWENRLRMIQT